MSNSVKLLTSDPSTIALACSVDGFATLKRLVNSIDPSIQGQQRVAARTDDAIIEVSVVNIPGMNHEKVDALDRN